MIPIEIGCNGTHHPVAEQENLWSPGKKKSQIHM